MENAKDRESHAAELERAIDSLSGVVQNLLVVSNDLEKILLGDIPRDVSGGDDIKKEIEPGGVFEKLRRKVSKIEGGARVVHDRLEEFIRESNPKRAHDEGSG